jgi:uncharacterized protein (TIGR03084 family)
VNDLEALRSDLINEHDALDGVVNALSDEQWHLATASPGWDVADQIAHLTYFDGTAALAINDPDAFRSSVEELVSAAVDRGMDEATLGPSRSLSPLSLLERWRQNRATLAKSALMLEPSARVAWYGPSMSAKSFLNARLMETWAHGTDVAHALGTSLPATDRLRHIAHLGYITRQWSYTVRGDTVPDGTVRLELSSPRGETWIWGPDSADDVVRGHAEEFCLVATQRRHVSDTSITTGELGLHWLLRAQAFAGGASEGPRPERDHATHPH